MEKHQRSIAFAVEADVITELPREGMLSELLYADDLVLISDTIIE